MAFAQIILFLCVASQSPTQLIFGLDYPSVYSLLCQADDLQVNVFGAWGIRNSQLRFQWTVESENLSNPIQSSLQDSDSKLTLKKQNLQQGLYDITIQAWDDFQNTVTRSIQIQVIEGSYIDLRIAGGSIQQVYMNQPNVIRPIIDLCQSNLSQSVQGNYYWEYIQTEFGHPDFNPAGILGAQQNNNYLVIQGIALNPQYIYTLKLTFTYYEMTSTKLIYLRVIEKPLVVHLTRGGGVVSNSIGFSFSSAQSYDQDSSYPVNFEWSCTTEGKECLDINEVPLLRSKTSPDHSWDWKELQINQKCDFVLKAYATDQQGVYYRETIKQFQIHIAPVWQATQVLEDTTERINPEQNIGFLGLIEAEQVYQFEWRIFVNGQLNEVKKTNEQYIMLLPGDLIQGVDYNYQLVSLQGDNVDQLITDRKFITNHGPVQKFHSVTCDPVYESNYTFVRINACGFVDGDELDYPLEFQYFLSQGYFDTAFTGKVRQCYEEILIWPGQHQVIGRVCDQMNTCVRFECNISINEGNAQVDSDQIWSLVEINPFRTMEVLNYIYNLVGYKNYDQYYKKYLVYLYNELELRINMVDTTIAAGYLFIQEPEISKQRIIELIETIFITLDSSGTNLSQNQFNGFMAIIEKYYLKYQSELQVYFDRLVEMYISKWVPSHRPMISMYHGTLLIFRYRTLEIKLDSLIIEDDLVRIEYQDDNTGFMQIQDLYDIKLEILKKDNKRTLSFQHLVVADVDNQYIKMREPQKRDNRAFSNTIKITFKQDIIDQDKSFTCVKVSNNTPCQASYNQDSKLQLTIIGTGNFELNEELREVVENGPLDDDREKCALNLTPVFVFTCISSLYLIIFAITFKLDNRLKVEEKYKPKIVHQEKVQFQPVPQNSVEFSGSEDFSQYDISRIGDQYEEESNLAVVKVDSQKPTYWRKFRVHHLFLGIFFSTKYHRMRSIAIQLSLSLFTILMQGILERDENSDDFKSFSDGIDDFNGRDFGLSLAGPVITMPAALMLIFCLQHTKFLRQIIFGYTLMVGFIVGSIIGITVINLELCQFQVGKWTLRFVIALIFEILAFESAYAALVCRIYPAQLTF